MAMGTIPIFDQKVKQLQKARAAANPDSPNTDYVKDYVAEALCDRLIDITREFPLVLDVGCGAGHVVRFVPNDRVKRLVQLESNEALLRRDENNTAIKSTYQLQPEKVVGDQSLLPFPPQTFDAVLSCLNLHWANDIEAELGQIRQVLKEDSPLIGCMFCEDTLFELRCSLQLAEQERQGGFSPHISPMIRASDVGGLLTETGFTLPTIDTDSMTVNYPSPLDLMHDLQAMGESNALTVSTGKLSRESLMAACAIYKEMYGNDDGTIPATFNFVYFIGWSPGPNQPKPAKRGSAKLSLKDMGKLFGGGYDNPPDKK